MAKKFGIDNNITSGKNTDATKTKTQGLHNALAGFLSINNGQGMMTWMMQSMLTLASMEMQQQYAE